MTNKKNKAAVLVLVCRQGNEFFIVLTKRHAHLKDHPGQISFPGGKVEEAESYEETARREFQEEVGDVPSLIIVGELPSQITSTAYEIYPIVAYVSSISFNLNKEEVEELILIPFSIIENEELYIINQDPLYKIIRHCYCFFYKDNFIWGVTATILKTLAENKSFINTLKQHFRKSTRTHPQSAI